MQWPLVETIVVDVMLFITDSQRTMIYVKIGLQSAKKMMHLSVSRLLYAMTISLINYEDVMKNRLLGLIQKRILHKLAIAYLF